MPNHKPMPPIERLLELFEVIEIPPEKFGEWSGLVWKVRRGGTAKAGNVAGRLQLDNRSRARSDWRVHVYGVPYLVSRVIYCMSHGADPGDSQVDHKDQNSLNNNVWNLRLDNDGRIQNVNAPKRRNNTSGIVGVSQQRKRKKWRAEVCIEGKNKYLGSFSCKLEAARAINDKWIELGWDKVGRKLNDLETIQCTCDACIVHKLNGAAFAGSEASEDDRKILR